MTGDLRLLSKFRDIQVAEDVGKKSELGYFDVEFTMYGCAYLNPKDANVYYKVSADVADIYDFVENAVLVDIFPSNVEHLTVKCSVPLGMREAIANDVKIQLAKQLKQMYPKSFFYELYQFAETSPNNHAAALLWHEADSISGIFEEEKLRKFEMLVDSSYSYRKLTRHEYETLQQWIADERQSMQDDFVSKDIFEKTIYGFAYIENGALNYVVNAQRDSVYEDAHNLERDGYYVLPIYHRTFWYNYVYRLSDVVKDFKKELRQEQNAAYLEKIKTIRGRCTTDITFYKETLAHIERLYGVNAEQTLRRYLYHWGLL